MLFGLAFETGLEAIFLRVNNEDGEVGLGHSGNHIGDEVSVTRSVEDGKACLLGFERHSGDVDRYAAVSLFVCLVHEPRKGERRFSDRLCLLPQLSQ